MRFINPKAYANQLSKGEDYPRLNPAIALTITDFILFEPSDSAIGQFVFYEKTNKFEYPDKELPLIFVELPLIFDRLDPFNIQPEFVLKFD